MDEEDVLALFCEHDDPVRWEYPKGFDYTDAVLRFREFAAAFDAATGVKHPIETGSHIQDASFHSQIDLGGGWLRFSNFGDMVSFDPSSQLGVGTFDKLRTLCRDNGYILIPPDFTELPYTGLNPGVTGIRDWGIRYFDWV